MDSDIIAVTVIAKGIQNGIFKFGFFPTEGELTRLGFRREVTSIAILESSLSQVIRRANQHRIEGDIKVNIQK